MNPRALMTLGAVVLACAGAIAWRLGAGGHIPAGEWNAVIELRAWRVATGAGVGVCLAVGGVLLQSLLRNPLASPDITGMSSAASLGVMCSLYLASRADGFATPVRAWQAAPALVGALGALVLVSSLSRRRGVLDPTAMVLIGVVVSVMCGAGVLLLQHLLPGVAMSTGGMRLLVGAISDDVSRTHVIAVGVLAILATLVAMLLGPWMDAGTLGDEEAASLGVPIARLRVVLLALAGVLTAGAVVLAGPLGFVGLVAPHAVRLMAGPGLGGAGKWGGNRFVVLTSALAGAALVVGADALVKTFPTRSGNMPIGIVTALLGGCTFIALLRAERASSGVM